MKQKKKHTHNGKEIGSDKTYQLLTNGQDSWERLADKNQSIKIHFQNQSINERMELINKGKDIKIEIEYDQNSIFKPTVKYSW